MRTFTRENRMAGRLHAGCEGCDAYREKEEVKGGGEFNRPCTDSDCVVRKLVETV